MIPCPGGIAFDLDDTLYDREAALRVWLRSCLLGMTPAFCQEILVRDGRGHAPREEFFVWLAACWPDGPVSGPQLWQRFREELPACIRPDPAAVPLLEELRRRGLRTAILTNGSAELQQAKLRAAGLAGWFEPRTFLTSGDLGFAKPDPRAFAALAAAMDLPAERILFVGDHTEKDIAGARQAGLAACWLRRRDPDGICAAAGLVIDSLAELVPCLFPPPHDA